MEYYDGMLFLTTNRMEYFDQAFYNRIHITIKYETLSPESRINIWRYHITSASKRNKRVNLWSSEVFEALGRIETNGRDIRNFTRTAYGYAKARGEDFRIKHIVTVIHNNL